MMNARLAQIIIKAAGYIGVPNLTVDEASRLAATIMGVVALVVDIALHRWQKKNNA